MCGIIGAFNFNKNTKNVNEDVLDILQDQIQRGKEGFGVSFIKPNGKVETKRATISAKAILDLYMNKAKMIIMHHRMPTSSENKISQTHPIEVDDSSLKHKYLTVHNGVIKNCDELRKEHESDLGFIYTTPRTRQWYNKEEEEYNDSEPLAIEVARYIEKQTTELKTKGSAAFITIQIDKATNKAKQIFFGRNDSNPLKLSADKGKIRLSSEGKGDDVKAFFLYNFSLKDFKIHKRKLQFAKKPKEFLPNIETNFHSSNDPFTVGDPNPYNSDISKNANKDIDEMLEDAIEDSVMAVDDSIVDYFSILSKEKSLLQEDADTLFKNTARIVLAGMQTAKNKAIDAFGEYLCKNAENTERANAAAIELQEEAELEKAELKEIELKEEKLHAK